MTSLILKNTVRFLLPLLLLFSIFLFLPGHNEPGGGFAAGLVAASAFALYSIAHGTEAVRWVMRFDPFYIIAAGLLVAASSGTISALGGNSFLTGVWTYLPLPGEAELDIGTPLLFDLGVLLVVTGATVKIVLALEEAE